MTDQSESEPDRCIWCERERELKHTSDNGFEFDGFIVAGPDGDCLTMEYGRVCHNCWDTIRDQWEREGTLTKPSTPTEGRRMPREEHTEELHHCRECKADVEATWNGGVLTCDECGWVIYK